MPIRERVGSGKRVHPTSEKHLHICSKSWRGYRGLSPVGVPDKAVLGRH